MIWCVIERSIHFAAHIVVGSFKVLETPIANIAHGSVWQMPDGKTVSRMDADYRARLVSYRTTMSLAEEMLIAGIINENDYTKIDRILAQKYGLSLGSIYCRKPLIDQASRGNIQHTEGR